MNRKTEPDTKNNDTDRPQTCAWLAGIRHGNEDIGRHLDELGELLSTLGIETAGRSIAPVKKPNPAFLTGRGKAEEIMTLAKESGASLIVFDDELSPSQQRNWEKASGLDVIDRQEVIISIFADRASTKEAALQVELASCQYRLPRLAGAWKHLSRQRGGFYGTRGEGEKQIEIDRRYLLKRIAKLKEELEDVSKQRQTRKKLRTGRKVFSCAIAGYTNAGKSTLLNALTGSDVSSGNRLFETLDPSTRKFALPGGREVVLTDTVGFIRKLPHQLIEAFKSTLEETLESDLIILLLDSSDSEVESHYMASMEVLEEIGADKKKIMTVLNKSDLCSDPLTVSSLKRKFPGAVFISAGTGENLDRLTEKIEEYASQGYRTVKITIPTDSFEILNMIRRSGRIVSEEYGEEGVAVEAVVTPETASRIEHMYGNQYSIENPE